VTFVISLSVVLLLVRASDAAATKLRTVADAGDTLGINGGVMMIR
jgi:hypothetical protein